MLIICNHLLCISELRISKKFPCPPVDGVLIINRFLPFLITCWRWKFHPYLSTVFWVSRNTRTTNQQTVTKTFSDVDSRNRNTQRSKSAATGLYKLRSWRRLQRQQRRALCCALQVFDARWIHVISRQSARRRRQHRGRRRRRRRRRHVRVVPIRLQLGTRDWGKRPLAAVRTFRCRAKC